MVRPDHRADRTRAAVGLAGLRRVARGRQRRRDLFTNLEVVFYETTSFTLKVKEKRECMGIEPTGSFFQTPHWF